MPPITRRQFIAGLTSSLLISRLWRRRPIPRAGIQQPPYHLCVARNGNPATNVWGAVALAGGIESFVDADDVVVLKPNGQWPNQGYTHTQSMKALIDLILDHPGGFSGEVIIAEHVHRSPSEALSGSYCWNMATDKRLNNWPNMNYFELVSYYHAQGLTNVTAVPLFDSSQSGDWDAVDGPADVAEGRHGWVRTTYTTAANGRSCRLSHPILRSGYSDKLIDLKNGVWQGGGYTGQQVKLIFLPTLNNHGSFEHEDYAGPTSAVKCHLGIVEFDGPGGSYTLHSVGYSSDPGSNAPDAVGESIGHLITQILNPTFYLTCAEYTGYRGRTTSTAERTRVVGLCTDPVTLDYWMCKYVMYPIAPSQAFMNPDNPSSLRTTLLGCQSKGVGTLDEAEMVVYQVDMAADYGVVFPLSVKNAD